MSQDIHLNYTYQQFWMQYMYKPENVNIYSMKNLFRLE